MNLTTPRKALVSLSLGLLLLFSTACIRADMGVSVKADGSGTISLTQAIDVKAFQDAAKQFGGAMGGDMPSSPSDIFSEKDVDTSKLPPGSKVEKFKDGNYEGVRITTPFARPEDILPTLNKVADSVEDTDLTSLGGSSSPSTRPTVRPGSSPTPARSSSSSSGSSSDAFDKFTLEKTSTGWKFDAVATSVGGSGMGDDAMSQAFLAAMLKDAQITFSLQLPGKVSSTNADSTNNGVMKWSLPLTSTQPKTMSAVTTGFGATSGGGDDGGFPIVVVIGVIVAVAVIGGLYYMSKKNQAPPPASPPWPPAEPTA